MEYYYIELNRTIDGKETGWKKLVSIDNNGAYGRDSIDEAMKINNKVMADGIIEYIKQFKNAKKIRIIKVSYEEVDSNVITSK